MLMKGVVCCAGVVSSIKLLSERGTKVEAAPTFYCVYDPSPPSSSKHYDAMSMRQQTSRSQSEYEL